MILAAIELENYKQYGGSHRIDFPEQGMIAITGPNGAGKTTLFEAIEWCLYGPRVITLASIPPHGGIGNTRVRVTLQDPNDERRYVVQRELRPSGTQAEVYTEDQPGQAVVQGPRDVSEFVAKQLIGLSHAAFVSTFFTRQKELTFFGDRAPTDRRVEVARLLGFQTIRDAQEELSGERAVARQAAVSLRSQYDRDSDGRDFDGEIAHTESALLVAQDQESATALKSTQAEAEVERARSALDACRGLQERDAALETAIAAVAGQTATAASRRDAAQEELRRLDYRASERDSLLTEAAEVDTLAFEVTLLDEQRALADQHRSLLDVRQGAAGRLDLISDRLQRLVLDHRQAAAELCEWSWSKADAASPEDGIARLKTAAASLDLGGAWTRVELLRVVCDAAPSASERAAIAARYREHHDTLAQRRRALLAAGDPAAAIAAAQEAARQARDAGVRAKEELARTRKSREDAQRLARELRDRAEEPICPTCSRPLGAAEAERLARLLDDEAGRLRETEAALKNDESTASALVVAAERDEAAARKRLDALTTLDGRLADGLNMVAEADEAHRRAATTLQDALDAAGILAVPPATELEAARVTAEHMQQIAGLLPLLDQLHDQAHDARRAVSEADRGIDALGPITYDAAAHRAAQGALDRGRAAAARIEEIDKELAGRPRYERQRDDATRELVDLASRRETLEGDRKTLGFDPAALRVAQEDEAAARDAARVAREEATQARDALRDAQAVRDRTIAERNRLEKLAADADRLGREADELDRMYREFAEFDKYVADHVGPLLAEMTERLLGQVTNGKYDRVRFDENYGIEVFDGDECFKLEGFSGGERDVVALCARLAMSELVGSSAIRPPRFLVLDEVFGSLDNERRAQLLETLGSLASSGHFQQMFIVSHVDDVQLSPVMNEAWTVEERDGVSRVVRPELFAAALA